MLRPVSSCERLSELGYAVTPGGTVVLDLDHITFIDCAGLAALLDAGDQVLEGQRVSMARPSECVVRLARLTGLSPMLDPGHSPPAVGDAG